MNRLLSAALLAAVAPVLGAQSVFDSELRFAPQFLQYQIHAPSNETISQFALPIFVTIPFGSRFTVDVGTSYARAHVTSGAASSEINGLTDTQVRGNLTLGSDYIVVTGGVNLPSGQSTVNADQITAAGRIGSDFLAFPISNMGTGLAMTGGIAIARPLGDWNLGFGGAVRHSAEYSPFDVPGQTALRFQPGDEYRARVGVDHPIGAGRFSLGLTYSKFGEDNAGGSIYNTGNRLIAQTMVTNNFSGTDVTVAAYNVFRGSGLYANGDPAGKENIANVYLGLGLQMLGTTVEPSIEGRHWLQNFVTPGVTGTSSQSSYLATLGLRTRVEVGQMSMYPSVGYTLGKLAIAGNAAATSADLTGFRAQVAIRVAP